MYSVQEQLGLDGPAWLDPVVAASIFGGSLVLAVLFSKFLFPLVLRLARRTSIDLDTRILVSLRLPVTLGLVVLGGYLALTLPFGQRDAVDTVSGLLGIALGIVAVASMLANAFDWYVETVAPRTPPELDDKLIPLFRRIAVPMVYGLGALIVLGQLGISITPLIAGLGLGGLAVALAIQPTLANLFAGTYVMTEGVISPGDYIELENGMTGYVVDVGWRSTRMRTWGNNLIIIPNSKFAETIVTNYARPVLAVNIYLTCGVSYDSDLYQVERVCKEVMDTVLDTNRDAVKEYGGWFGFESFGDSNVNFWLFLQAKDRLASFVVRTDLIQRLHQRFREEEIVINYPMRSLQLPKEWSPEAFTSRNSG